MKCSELLLKGTRMLKEKGIAACRLEAEVLLAFAWGRERTHLLIFSDDPVPEDIEKRFNELLCRRARGVPIAYLTGEKEFMSLGFAVNSHVLIPRPETELLVEMVLDYLDDRPSTANDQLLSTNNKGCRTASMSGAKDREEYLIADVGTGSGAVAVSLAYYNHQAYLMATDISSSALQVAERNARRHGVAERVEFLQGDLLTPLLEQGITGKGAAVAANLPYIPTSDLESLPLDVHYEPSSALDGGKDGLEQYRRLLPQVATFLAPGGLLVCEIGVGQGEVLREMLTNEGWAEAEIIKDYAGRERIVKARR
ncbi:MAG TPA: peptide chain release factor N(5)-glutamine methyltransferase [Peptococcaceae bacterium]|nr:peptide chain release factor N(5)-glutamine methyltransferase [Peptococcaceae bacterium]HBI26489.1 peptide chain release factor N(5)-glutamine methyltransferase [Peptococcaceae bacterium]